MHTQIIDTANSLWSETLQKLRHDTYHLPEYFCLEARRTKTIPEAVLITEGESILFVPYLLRQCDDIFTESIPQEIFDIVSPYGYPSILLSEAANNRDFLDLAISELKKVLSSKGVCSAFFRLHPILNHNFDEIFPPDTFTFNGQTVSVDLTLSVPEIWAHTRKGHQSTINKCKRLGFTARMVPVWEYFEQFLAIYEQTMNRVGAKEVYYFDNNYFSDLSKLGDKLSLCIVEFEGEVISASLFFECCGIVQAHLGGTKTEFLSQSPFNLLLDYARYWAKERGNEFLHIGGGIGGSKEDSLYTFKSGFSKQRHTFLTLRMVADEDMYDKLVRLQAKELNLESDDLLKSNFFPAYRFQN